MASRPIHWVLVRVYVHATEEEDRVRQALDVVCPGGETRREVLEGQHGNLITHLLRRVEDSGTIAATWAAWERSGIVAGLRDRLEERIDEDGILHFRAGKQEAFAGTAVLAADPEGDTLDVQVKLKAFPARPEEIRRTAHALVEGAR